MKKTPMARDMIDLPGFFTFKIIVKADSLDEDRLMDMARRELGRPLRSPELNARSSREGNYQAYTFRLFIDVYEEIEKLYLAFQTLPNVQMIL